MKVGQKIATERANWSFSGDVADTFVDHITKSVPGYAQGHELVCQLSDFFVHDDSTCYEIGTSTGELIGKLAQHNAHKKNIKWIGSDIEAPMVKKAQEHCKNLKNVQIIEADANLLDFEKSDLIVSYYTMQFIQPRYRQELFTKIYESLNWGGAFIMFEKVRGPDARFQDIASQLYMEYKISQGFDESEIVNKSRSLKSVLEPFSTQGNIDLLTRAGFKDITTVFKYICFEGFLAIK
jgi:tRNA (cmo5U34)-methyltransferase